jgi:CheY-like chemotaxis protein
MTAALSDLSRRPRVLVVDSDAGHRELYRASLTIAGWDVAEAVDGRDALVQALSTWTSLVLTELCLSFIDGVSLCEILRHDQMTLAVPILVVTSETRATELARATWAGASAVLIKPSTPDLIINEMNRLLATTAVDSGSWPARSTAPCSTWCPASAGLTLSAWPSTRAQGTLSNVER